MSVWVPRCRSANPLAYLSIICPEWCHDPVAENSFLGGADRPHPPHSFSFGRWKLIPSYNIRQKCFI
jgi:hypothetical protein